MLYIQFGTGFAVNMLKIDDTFWEQFDGRIDKLFELY